MKQLFTLSLTLLIIITTAASGLAQSWNLAKDKNGVKVYTRKRDGWGIKEYKVKINVKATLSKVRQVLQNDVKSRKKWSHNCLEVREVERSGDVVCIYNKVDAPWPVADRDNVTRFEFVTQSSKQFRINMSVLKSHAKAPEYSGVVRIKRLKGYWIINDHGNGVVSIMQQCVADPGGSIPDWLANTSVVDSPYNSMWNLKKYLEGRL